MTPPFRVRMWLLVADVAHALFGMSRAYLWAINRAWVANIPHDLERADDGE